MLAAKSIDQRLADSFIKDIEQSVEQAELNDACKKLQDFVEGLAPQLKQETLTLCSRHALFQKDRRQGRAHRDEAIPIMNAVLELATEAHRCALLRPQYRLQPEQVQKVSSGKISEGSNVTPIRPVEEKPARTAPDAEDLDNLRRFYWERFRDTRPPDETEAFVCRDICKRYRKGNFSLDPVSFTLRAGEVTGVVGRNASGKTTLLRLVLGDLAPDSGTTEYPMLTRDGRGWAHIKRQIAYVSQTQTKWHGKLRYNLNFIAAAYGTLGKANRQLVDWHIQRFGLAAYEDFTWDEMTGGYKTRFELVRALLTRPKLLVLDEPLAQLDVMARQSFLSDIETIANSFERPVPIIITSQHLYEIEAIANQMIVLDQGKLVHAGRINDIGRDASFKVIEITLRASDPAVRAALSALDLQNIEKTMEGFILRFPRHTQPLQVYTALFQAFGEQLVAFRDITQSARSLFRSEGHEAPKSNGHMP